MTFCKDLLADSFGLSDVGFSQKEFGIWRKSQLDSLAVSWRDGVLDKNNKTITSCFYVHKYVVSKLKWGSD